MQKTPQLARALKIAPVRFGDVELDCAVVEMPDGTIERLLSTRKFNLVLGRNERSQIDRRVNVTETPPFMASKSIIPFVSSDLKKSTTLIWYRAASGHKAAGYRASILPDVCDAYLEAWQAGALHHTQQATAQQCLRIVRALSKTGIDALIDEATGFQEIRHKTALQDMFDLYLAERALPWKRQFEYEFYYELYRVKGKLDDYRYLRENNSTEWHGWTGDFIAKAIYERFFPATLLAELRSRSPRIKSGGRMYKLHQLLNEAVGKPELNAAIRMVLGVLKKTPTNDMHNFWYRLDMVSSTNLQLSLSLYDET